VSSSSSPCPKIRGGTGAGSRFPANAGWRPVNAESGPRKDDVAAPDDDGLAADADAIDLPVAA